ncbi:MAG TPA: hypothetical protein VHT97_00750 [Acidimicrobiales bacterium]|jgi:hypothetical protein|nr:hypothetical protein [Acidimicrobiales bacterium]
MSPEVKPAVVLTALCAVLDLVAGVALMAASGSDSSMLVVGAVTVVLGVLSVVAAVGLAQGRRWAVPLVVATRGLDVVTALPGLGQGPGQVVAIAFTVVISAATIVAVLRVGRSGMPLTAQRA